MIPVLTIDGPSGVGKGTVANIVAADLKWHILDSGAIYRAFALAASKRDIQVDNTEQLLELASNLDLRFAPDSANNVLGVYLDNQEVSSELRTEKTAELASKFAMIRPLRESLLKRQQDFRKLPGLVADGRDMGTVVFKDAPYKVFLTANVEERAKRRLKQLHLRGITGNISHTLEDVRKRDERDASRKHSPLKPSKDALIIDTSDLTVDEVVTKVMALVKV
jgi:cytidylate kinase